MYRAILVQLCVTRRPRAADAMLHAMETDDAALTHLEHAMSHLMDTDDAALTHSIGECTRLATSAYISVDPGDEDGSSFGIHTVLASSLKKNGGVMDLSHKELTDVGIRWIAPKLPLFAKPLKQLDLCWNKIGDAGAIDLARSLPKLTCLRSLLLFHNRIGDFGATALANAMIGLTMLQQLLLCENRIGDEGAMALAQTLPVLKGLLHLTLDLNQIGDAGATALSFALVGSMNIISVRIQSNKISDAGATELIQRLPHLMESYKLYLGGNNISDDFRRTHLKAWAMHRL